VSSAVVVRSAAFIPGTKRRRPWKAGLRYRLRWSALLFAFNTFATLREMLLPLGRFFHAFKVSRRPPN
jgi:hypothetical protein